MRSARALATAAPPRLPPACRAGLSDQQENLLVNPAELPLPGAGATLIVVGPSKRALQRALKKPYQVS